MTQDKELGEIASEFVSRYAASRGIERPPSEEQIKDAGVLFLHLIGVRDEVQVRSSRELRK